MDTNRVSTKNKVWFLVIGIILVLGLVFGIMTIFTSGEEQDDGEVDISISEMLDNNYNDVGWAQGLFEDMANGSYAFGLEFFFKNTKDSINKIGEIMNKFSTDLNNVNVNEITDELVLEDFTTLLESMKTNLPAYTDTVTLYNLLYEYIENDYSAEKRKQLLALNNQKITSIVDKIDAAAKDGTLVYPGMSEEILAVYTDYEAFDEIYYCDVMGRIIALVRDFGGYDEYSEE